MILTLRFNKIQVNTIKNFSLLLFFAFLLNTFYLLYKSFLNDSIEMAYIETGRFIIPIFLFFTFPYLKEKNQDLIINLLFFILLLHIFIALVFSQVIYEDGRFIAYYLGRGSTDTAFAITTLCIASFNKKIQNFFIIPRLLNFFLIFLTFYFIMRTQSRASFIYIISFLLLFYEKKILLFIIKEKFSVLLILPLIFFFGSSFLQRFTDPHNLQLTSFFSGRIEIWLSFFEYLLNLEVCELLFGKNYSIHEAYQVSYGGLISDSHNIFLDLIKHLGLLTTIIFLLVLVLQNKFSHFKISLLLSFFSFNLLNDSLRFSYIIYASILVLFLLLSRD
jgi:hypothetical protein